MGAVPNIRRVGVARSQPQAVGTGGRREPRTAPQHFFFFHPRVWLNALPIIFLVDLDYFWIDGSYQRAVNVAFDRRLGHKICQSG